MVAMAKAGTLHVTLVSATLLPSTTQGGSEAGVCLSILSFSWLLGPLLYSRVELVRVYGFGSMDCLC